VTAEGRSSEALQETVAARIFGASVIGPLHVRLGLPCQDACSFRSLEGESAVIAVADGLGSASRSEVGAQLAVEAACRTATEILERPGPEESLGDVVKAAVTAARSALEQRVGEDGVDLRDLACTLIVVAVRRDRIATAHIGDGAVVADAPPGLLLVSAPGDSEYANEVTPLTSDDWESSLRIIPLVVSVRSFAVLTDGCQRAALRKVRYGFEPFEPFFSPIFAYARGLADTAEGDEEVRALLSSAKVRGNSEDDKTLVVATIQRRA
jgi:hypothetical protein